MAQTAGVVKLYNESRGYGFIQRAGEKDLFFHISQVRDGYQPRKGDQVEFEEGPGRKGPEAKNVRPASAAARESGATMEVTQEGSAKTSSGSCTIICGLQGEALPALSAPQRGHGKGSYATFHVGQHIQVHGHWYKGTPTQIEVVEVTPTTADPIRQTLWEGTADELPETLSYLERAVQAADAKAACYHCHCLHFMPSNISSLR
jgi:CspA family cold shock protein